MTEPSTRSEDDTTTRYAILGETLHTDQRNWEILGYAYEFDGPSLQHPALYEGEVTTADIEVNGPSVAEAVLETAGIKRIELVDDEIRIRRAPQDDTIDCSLP
ncbi:hypothetical protein SAMN05216388_102536 [Halorientalis persicus]|uniref:Uncharacterized protein n=1 Tax=Halorientalis persicus TaxID=1367881 RepID=A0A1H8U2T0_9EURY|nr:hypothetical protein [Halorientalis persicus]SEO97580.1 hypothetical protein SAMN05216388_102536 [Halorientalis persicus]